MKIKIIILVVFLLQLSCTADYTQQESSYLEHLEDHSEKVGEEIIEDWDRHQYFNDTEWTSLDSLGKIINNSDSIVAYLWNDDEKNSANVKNYIVDAYGTFSDRIGNRILLDESQKEELNRLLTDSLNYDEDNASCFIPHIAFVYFKKSEIIGQSNVCFMCAGIKSIPKSTSGMSPKGVNDIKKFCKNLGLKINEYD